MVQPALGHHVMMSLLCDWQWQWQQEKWMMNLRWAHDVEGEGPECVLAVQEDQQHESERQVSDQHWPLLLLSSSLLKLQREKKRHLLLWWFLQEVSVLDGSLEVVWALALPVLVMIWMVVSEVVQLDQQQKKKNDEAVQELLLLSKKLVHLLLLSKKFWEGVQGDLLAWQQEVVVQEPVSWQQGVEQRFLCQKSDQKKQEYAPIQVQIQIQHRMHLLVVFEPTPP